MLLGAGYALPRQLLIHGYLTVRDEKMSKTKGNVLDPFRVIDHYGLDALRYYLFRDVRFGGDGAVSYDSRARALSRRPRQRPRQPRQPLRRDDRPLPRRRRARRGTPTPRIGGHR